MKNLLVFVQELVYEIGELNGVSTSRDCNTIAERFEHEGMSFLTITLPNYCKDFERSLDNGFVDPFSFAGFSRTGPLPRFLGGLVGLVFDHKTGVLRDDWSAAAVRSVRQITLLMSKLLLDCSPERVAAAFANYITIEKEVREADARVIEPDVLGFSHELPGFSTETLQYASRVTMRMVTLFPHTALDPTWIDYVETRSGFMLIGPNGAKHIFLSGSMLPQVGWTITTVYPSPIIGLTFRITDQTTRHSVNIVESTPTGVPFTIHVDYDSFPRNSKNP